MLYVFYKFDKWHIVSNFYLRPYKVVVLDSIKSLQTNCVVEVGCGLGEIISRIPSDMKIGIDSDSKAIAAASFLYGGRCKFMEGSFNDLTKILLKMKIKKVDMLIMVNWPHLIPFMDLELICY